MYRTRIRMTPQRKEVLWSTTRITLPTLSAVSFLVLANCRHEMEKTTDKEDRSRLRGLQFPKGLWKVDITDFHCRLPACSHRTTFREEPSSARSLVREYYSIFLKQCASIEWCRKTNVIKSVYDSTNNIFAGSMLPVDANMSMGHPAEGSAAHNAHNAGSGLPSATVWKVNDF